MNQTGPAGYVD